ncbi:endoribonuclease E-like protein [Tanacetum coccineum]|uniref:Endoribonuclease E-like protein n=1 Tax=Tanacetum coccineum TaxID=301880 RepID=A0ABQ5APB4_9ASTR
MLVVGLGEWWKSDSENVINKALKSDQSLMLRRAEATVLGKAGCVNLDVLEVPRSRTGFIGDKNGDIVKFSFCPWAFRSQNLKQASIALKQGKSMIIAGLAESKKDHAIALLAKLKGNLRKKMTKDERKALIKVGRDDSVKSQSKAVVKQPKELSGSSTMFLGISDQWTKEVRAKAHSSMRMTNADYGLISGELLEMLRNISMNYCLYPDACGGGGRSWISHFSCFLVRTRKGDMTFSSKDERGGFYGTPNVQVDEEMEIHAELLKEIEDSPMDINAIVTKRRRDFTGEFFRYVYVWSWIEPGVLDEISGT